MASIPRVLITTLLLIALCVAFACAVHTYDNDLPRGPYCAEVGCCSGRIDECAKALPQFSTLCYCDDFCNRTHDDCCPDFLSHCKGVVIEPEPIKACYHNGRYYPRDHVLDDKENCNNCKCEDMNGRMEVLCEKNVCLMEEFIIHGIQKYQHGWTAMNYSQFWGRSFQDGLTLRLGTLLPERLVMRMNAIRHNYDPNALPREYDVESTYPGFVSRIQDQGWCGSSWAISTAAVASDRFTIMSKGVDRVILSAQNLVSCDKRGQQSCFGGALDKAWMFTRKSGLVDEQCMPYRGQNVHCTIPRGGDLRTARCELPKNPFRTDKYRVGPAYKLGNETDIMYEIMRSGPVQATMKVYHDFFAYRSGVYRHSDLGVDDRTGYHSVRIVGWGQENDYTGVKKYWKVANSWGSAWGENGYFRIVRGSNECEIESFVIAVKPEIIIKPHKKYNYY